MLETRTAATHRTKRKEKPDGVPAGTTSSTRREPPDDHARRAVNLGDYLAVTFDNIVVEATDYDERRDEFGPAVLIAKTALRRHPRRPA